MSAERASATSLVGRSVEVEAPATIANLGAGYDCLGLAVDLLLRASVEAVDIAEGGRPVEVTIDGEGAGELPSDRSNRLVLSLEKGLTELGYREVEALGWRVRMSNPIPLERGLGSSAAATVAGLVAAWGLAGVPVGASTALRLATAIEGHPDNVAPALFGGVVASIALDDRVEAVRLDPPPGVGVLAWIPERRLPTSDMRRVLPDSVPRADAIANLARVAVGVAGLASGRSDVLGLLTEDRLHEPYRASAYPELPRLVAAARDAGALGAFLAGAGSTVCAIVDAGDLVTAERVGAAFRATAQTLRQPGELRVLAPGSIGARLVA